MNTTGRTLNYGEEQSIKERIQDIDDALLGREHPSAQGVNFSSPNAGLARRKKQELESILKSQGVRDISAKEHDEMEKECRMIEEKIQTFPNHKMPTWDQYIGSNPKGGFRHDKLVEWCGWFNSNPQIRQLVQRWKSLKRHLEPHDPRASHMNRLFPE